MTKYFSISALLIITNSIFAQQNIVSQKGELIKIMVSPQSKDFNYPVGEKVFFDVALYKFGKLLNDETIYYETGKDKMPSNDSGYIQLKNGKATIAANPMEEPGFLRCYIAYEENGIIYENTGTAGIDPDKIRPVVKEPSDFDDFWSGNLKELAKIPVNPLITLMPEKCTPTVNVYKVRMDNIPVVGNHITHVYGILCIPKNKERLPAILKVPGAGVRPYKGMVNWAEKGFITLEIGINGIPVDLYDSDIYEDLKYGALWRYAYYNIDSRDKAYMKRVFLSCIRAVDLIYSLDEFDGENLGVTGGSQGGALSIVTASLDSRVKACVAYYPAMCDMAGYPERAGGWPHMFTGNFVTTQQKIEVAAYYDVVNFAKRLRVPGYFSYGYNDNVCPPTSICAALNGIKSKKIIVPFYDESHWNYKEASQMGKDWLVKQLSEKK
jgi:cephalosporin-C deacetylase